MSREIRDEVVRFLELITHDPSKIDFPNVGRLCGASGGVVNMVRTVLTGELKQEARLLKNYDPENNYHQDLVDWVVKMCQ